MWCIYAIKNKKKVRIWLIFPVTPVPPVTLIKKTFFRPRIPKEPNICVTSFTSSITSFFSSDKLYHFRLPLNYLSVSPPKLSLPSFSDGIVPFYGAF